MRRLPPLKRLVAWFAGCGCLLPLGGLQAASPIEYASPVQLAVVQDGRIRESSGLAVCRSRQDAFWTHNDSPGVGRLFLIGADGKTLGTVVVDGLGKPGDWEDMASFRSGGRNYLLIGDVGDNRHRRTELALCLLREPDMSRCAPSPALRVRPLAMLRFRFPDGPQDCEALAVDAGNEKILLATKSLLKPCVVYWLPLVFQTPAQPLVARRIAQLDAPLATGMDVSDDACRAIIVTYLAAYEIVRSPNESWATAFSRSPRLLRVPQRRQGEAICYGRDGRSLYLSSEGALQPLWHIPARPAPTPGG